MRKLEAVRNIRDINVRLRSLQVVVHFDPMLVMLYTGGGEVSLLHVRRAPSGDKQGVGGDIAVVRF